MDPMQPIQPGQTNQPNQNPIPQMPNPTTTPSSSVPADPISLEEFIRQNAANQGNTQTSAQATPQPMPGVFPPMQPKPAAPATPQVVEKIVYKQQRVHGFFRTLTIISLVVIGFLMLLEALNVFKLNISGFDLSLMYPIFILFSSIVIWSYRGLFGKIFGLLLFLIVVGGFFTIGVYTGLNPSTQTKFGSYVSYPSVSGSQYSKLYFDGLVTDITLAGKQTQNLIEGNYGSDRKMLVFSGSTGNYQYYSLQEEKNLNLLQNYYSVLSLGVSSSQPVYLYVKNLLSLQKIDLSNVKVGSLKIHGGAMILDLILGNMISSTTTIDVESAIADVTLHLPKDVGVKLYYNHLVGQLALADFEQKSDGYFESKNIATAQKIVTITMKFGGARTNVVWDK